MKDMSSAGISTHTPVPERVLTFTKQLDETRLRITYSDSLSVRQGARTPPMTGHAAAEWRIFIDLVGVDKYDTGIYTTVYQTHMDFQHDLASRQSTVVGTVDGVQAGNYILTVEVKRETSNTDAYTGFGAKSVMFIQVEEIPQPADMD